MTSIQDNNLIGFYASFGSDDNDMELVKEFIWGDQGLKNKLNLLKWHDYGQDFHLILFQFYVKPIQSERDYLKEIENYRPKEKSIGIPLIIDEDNFFKLNINEQQLFLKETILKKLDLIAAKIKRNKLDLDLYRLKRDVEKLL